MRAFTASGSAGLFEIVGSTSVGNVGLPSVGKETDMGDLVGTLSAGLAVIVSILRVERTLSSVLSFTASALKYFSSCQLVDMAEKTRVYE